MIGQLLTLISVAIFVHLSAITPHEVFLWSFDQTRREVSKFGLEFLIATLLQDLFPIEDVVLLAVSER